MSRGGESGGNRRHNPTPTKLSRAPSEARKRNDTRILWPANPQGTESHKGVVVCARCHAIWEHKHWKLDEPRYQLLSEDPAIQSVVCMGCEKIEREEYDGIVTLTSPLIPENEEAILGLIRNTEEHIREHNPLARIAQLTIEGDRIEILTITPFLAERIGKELNKAYHGQLEIQHPQRAKFVRVMWYRD